MSIYCCHCRDFSSIYIHKPFLGMESYAQLFSLAELLEAEENKM